MVVVVAIIFNVIITFLQDIEDQIRGDSALLDKRHRQAYLKWPLPPQQKQKFKTLIVGKKMMAFHDFSLFSCPSTSISKYGTHWLSD